MKITQISFSTTPEEAALVAKIAKRAVETVRAAGGTYDQVCAEMDLAACHLNGCPLNLQKLLDAEDFEFSHDVLGIRRHLNRATGELDDCFLPRASIGGRAKKSRPEAVDFETRQFELAHGKQPRGTGSWAFQFLGPDQEKSPWWAKNELGYTSMPYGEAKKLARKEAQARGCTAVEVLS